MGLLLSVPYKDQISYQHNDTEIDASSLSHGNQALPQCNDAKTPSSSQAIAPINSMTMETLSDSSTNFMNTSLSNKLGFIKTSTSKESFIHISTDPQLNAHLFVDIPI